MLDLDCHHCSREDRDSHISKGSVEFRASKHGQIANLTGQCFDFFLGENVFGHLDIVLNVDVHFSVLLNVIENLDVLINGIFLGEDDFLSDTIFQFEEYSFAKHAHFQDKQKYRTGMISLG